MTEDAAELDRLHDWIERSCVVGALAVVTHRNGDMDTVGSACALASALGPLARACGVHLSALARAVTNRSRADFTCMDGSRPLWPRRLGGVLVVDAASPSQLGLDLPPGIPVCVLDHHSGGSDWGIAELHLNWPTSSAAEIVLAYLERHRPDTLDDPTRRLLLAGVVSDTGRFRHANAASLAAAARLVEGGGVDFSGFIEELEQVDLDYSQKVAVSRALNRVQVEQAGDWFLLHTSASTHEGVVARALLAAGADVALVVRKAKDEVRLVSRAGRRAVREGVDLGGLMAGLSSRIGGDGGGHPGAAGWSGDVPDVTALSGFISDLSATRRIG
ncbi:MAG: DHH family phosphoesterase [Candidatus Poseidoniales archaeon]|nr:DHH family phosphoesterase [Candidatus Poseidoniales archaeon]